MMTMTNNKQQDPIDWLIQNISGHGFYSKKDEIVIKQAKKMFAKAIIEAINKGWKYNEDGFVGWMGEQYYNETYGDNKK